MKSNIAEKIKLVALNGRELLLSEPKDVEKLTLHDLGVDSLALLSFICRLEEEFKIKVSDDDLSIENFHDISSIYRTISKYI